MATATVTSKGQITIPVAVRAKLDLVPGSRVTFVPTESGGFEIHRQSSSIRGLKGAVARPARAVSVDDMNEAIAAGAADIPPDSAA